MTLETLLHHRRAVRSYSKTDRIDTQKVKKCIELAQLAPTSSNLQLWEAYHITDPKILAQLAEACLSQRSAATAQEIVVFVTRQDLYKQRAKQVCDFGIQEVKRTAPEEKQAARIEKTNQYYKKMIPLVYARFFGLLGAFRQVASWIRGLSKPTVRSLSESDMQTVVHKSCALVVQTFMLAMAEQGYDTCPLEGFDAWRIKKILNLPHGAEVSIVVTCGIRDEAGIRGGRYRIPFEQQYKKL